MDIEMINQIKNIAKDQMNKILDERAISQLLLPLASPLLGALIVYGYNFWQNSNSEKKFNELIKKMISGNILNNYQSGWRPLRYYKLCWMNQVDLYFKKIHSFGISNSLLIYGSPGVGKSYIINHLHAIHKESIIAVNSEFIVNGKCKVSENIVNLNGPNTFSKHDVLFDQYLNNILQNCINKIFFIDEIDKFPFNKDNNILRRLLMFIGKVNEAGGIVIAFSNKGALEYPSELIRTGRLGLGIEAKLVFEDYKAIFRQIFDAEYKTHAFNKIKTQYKNDDIVYEYLDRLAQEQYEKDILYQKQASEEKYNTDDLHSISRVITVLDILQGAHNNIIQNILNPS